MKSELAHAKTFRLSDRLRVEITAGTGGMICEWDPTVPSHLTVDEARTYRAAFEEMVVHLGKRAVVVTLPGGE